MSTQQALVVPSVTQIALSGQLSFREGTNPKRQDDVYTKLAASLFETMPRRSVVAFASVPSGAGVTHVVRNLAANLIRSGKSVDIRDGALSLMRIPGLSNPIKEFESGMRISELSREVESESTEQIVSSLRDQHDCVLLDCGSVEESAGLIRLGPICDGVVLVAEAGGVSKAQMDRAARSVRRLQCELLGVVLNKRRYPIPSWLYRLL